MIRHNRDVILSNAREGLERQQYSNVKTWTNPQGQVRVVQHVPTVDAAIEIQRSRTQQAESDDQPTRDERLSQIADELGRWARVQRLSTLEIGGLYCEAKKLLPHGEFWPWAEKAGQYGKSAVHNYMRVYRCCCGRPELVERIKPTMLQLICQPCFPADLWQEIYDRRGVREGTTVAKLMEVSKEIRAMRLTVSDEKVQRLLRDRETETHAEVLGTLDSSIRESARNWLKQLAKMPKAPDVQKRIDLAEWVIQSIDAMIGKVQ